MNRQEQERCSSARQSLEASYKRLHDLEERGDDACSPYDLQYGYNAEFNIRLKKDHIAWDEAILAECAKIPKQGVLFPAPDAHLESAYEDMQSGMEDLT